MPECGKFAGKVTHVDALATTMGFASIRQQRDAKRPLRCGWVLGFERSGRIGRCLRRSDADVLVWQTCSSRKSSRHRTVDDSRLRGSDVLVSTLTDGLYAYTAVNEVPLRAI